MMPRCKLRRWASYGPCTAEGPCTTDGPPTSNGPRLSNGRVGSRVEYDGGGTVPVITNWEPGVVRSDVKSPLNALDS